MNNAVILTGRAINKPKFSHEAYDERFYRFIFAVDRTSGIADKIPVLISEQIFNIRKIVDGIKLKISGEFRSYNKRTESKPKLVLDVFATDICEVSDEPEDNKIDLFGHLCKEPAYRITPLGREITDLLIAVNRANGKTDYIPMISWGRIAKCARYLTIGDPLRVTGRIQSRNYIKNNEPHTAYEVSISKFVKEDDMIDINDKEVDYESYCEYCKHSTLEDFEEPCNTCMETFFRPGTSVPLNYEEA